MLLNIILSKFHILYLNTYKNGSFNHHYMHLHITQTHKTPVVLTP